MKLVIFDLDDTLIDFASTRQRAYAQIAQRLDAQGLDSAGYLRACAERDRPLFALFEQGQITRDEYRRRRFAEPFAAIGVTPEPERVEQINRLFMDCVNDRPLLYRDVEPALQRLRAAGLQLAILTNGPSDGQRRKLRATGLNERVDHVAIGEELGASKPAARAFHAVLEHFGLSGHSALMVGDSPQLDYDAALAAGLNALLLEREARQAFNGPARTAIRSLDELLR